ncbi:MAG: IS3 family transposase, partial [Rhizobiaceae bacterium]
MAALLRVEGWQVNHKKVERLWREEGLQLPQRHKKRRRLYHKDSSVIRLRPKYPITFGAFAARQASKASPRGDFVHDKLSNGR